MRFEPMPPHLLPDGSRVAIEAGMASGLYTPDGEPAFGDDRMPAIQLVNAYNSTVMAATYATQAAIWRQGLLDDRLRELMRLRSAQVNNCDGCSAALKDPDVAAEDVACMVIPNSDQFSERERAALDVVTKLATNPDAFDDAYMHRLLELFSPAEVLEVVHIASVMLGAHRFNHVFRTYEAGTPLIPFDPAFIDAGAAELAAR